MRLQAACSAAWAREPRTDTLLYRGGELLTPTLDRNSQKYDSLHKTTLMSEGWLKLFHLHKDITSLVKRVTSSCGKRTLLKVCTGLPAGLPKI